MTTVCHRHPCRLGTKSKTREFVGIFWQHVTWIFFFCVCVSEPFVIVDDNVTRLHKFRQAHLVFPSVWDSFLCWNCRGSQGGSHSIIKTIKGLHACMFDVLKHTCKQKRIHAHACIYLYEQVIHIYEYVYKYMCEYVCDTIC